MNKETNKARVIFVAGIMPRSGTNFLANLLCKHADCEKSMVDEDWFLKEANYLTLYGHLLAREWKYNKEFEESQGFESHSYYKDLLLESIGGGLIEFLRQVKEKVNRKMNQARSTQEEGKLLVTKTPQVGNLLSFFKLFPDEKLILIVRDGRTLVESIIKSFNRNTNENYNEAIRRWVFAAKSIRRFEESHERNKYLLVRYEDLHMNTEGEMHKILNFLELDIEKYDFTAAFNLPVMGSCEFKRGDGEVHWQPVKKTDEFRPLERSANWTRARHERFNWLAKNELIYFGYEPKVFTGKKILWTCWNNLLDFKYGVGFGVTLSAKLFNLMGKKIRMYYRQTR